MQYAVVRDCSIPNNGIRQVPSSNNLLLRPSHLAAQCISTPHSTVLKRYRRYKVHSAHDLTPLDGGSQNDQDTGMPHDEIDRALLKLQQYAKNPASALRELRDFAVASVFLMRHVYTPSVWKSVWRACLVMIVVLAFMSMIWGLDLLLKQAMSRM